MQYALILNDNIVLYVTGHYTAVHCMCMVYYRSYNAWCLYRVMHFSAFMQCASLLECTCDEVTVCNFLQFAPQHCVQRLQSASSYYTVFEQKSVKKKRRKINVCNVHCTFVQCFVQLQCVEVHWPRRDAPGKSCTAFSSSLTKMGQKASKIWSCLAIADALFRAQSALKKWSNDQKDTLSSDNLVLCMAIWLSLANIQLHKKEQGTRYEGKKVIKPLIFVVYIWHISCLR